MKYKIYLFLLIIIIQLNSCNLQTEKKESILNIAMLDVLTLDPQKDLNVEVGYIAMSIFDRLVEFDKNGNLIPTLLEKLPMVSDDKLTYTFNLKKDIYFTNGQKITSNDVKFTFERMLTPKTNSICNWILDMVEGSKEIQNGKTETLLGFNIIDDVTFKIKLEKPYVAFIQGLTTPYASIFPEKECKKLDDKWGDNPIGSGAFKLSKWNKKKSLEFVKNNNYWGVKPKIDRIYNKIYNDNWDFAGMQADYDLNNISFLFIPQNKYKEYTSKNLYQNELHKYKSLNTKYITLNNQNEILKNNKVRQALSLAIDRDKMCSIILGGASVPAYTMIPEGILGYDKSIFIDYNVTKAKSLIAEAGYSDGFHINYYQANKNFLEMDYAIQIMLEQIGVKLNIISVNDSELNDIKKKGLFTMCISNWWADIPDADNFLYNLFYSKLNRSSKYNNPIFDQMCDFARFNFNNNEREKIYKELDSIICTKDWVSIPISHSIDTVLIKPYLKDVIINPITNLPDFRVSYIEH